MSEKSTFEKSWNLYICRFVISSKVIDHTEKGDFLIEDTHSIQIEMFKSDTAEAAYAYANSIMSSLTNAYRNEKGQEVQDVCLGINELFLLQESITSIKTSLEKQESLTLDVILAKEMCENPENLIRKKGDLNLFDSSKI